MKNILSGILIAIGLIQPIKSNAQEAFVQRDTAYYFELANHDVNSTRTFANDTLRYRFNQLRFNVKTVMPYVNAATGILTEVNTKLSTASMDKKERKRYLATQETELREKFENKVNSLNETQAVLLIKLIGRQSNLNLYSILQEVKGNFQAFKYQTWARMNGYNLAKKYDPESEQELENVLASLGY